MRIDSYENKENQELVRKFLNGRFENTAFVLLSPDGKPLTRKGSRSPLMTFGSTQTTVDSMNIFSLDYVSKNLEQKPDPQDFDSVKTSINVASADQRPLILIICSADQRKRLFEKMRYVFSYKDVIGRFHFDFETPNGEWKKLLYGNIKSDEGIFIVYPDEFGQKGRIVKQLSLEVSNRNLVNELKSSNIQFVRVTPVKNYSSHIRKGRALNIFFEYEIPYGEDRNGDGIIDHRGGIQNRRGRQ